MDSGNSGSLQSSSGGGDDEYDSRSESISSFLKPSAHFVSIQEQPPPPPFLTHHQQPLPPTLFSHHLPPTHSHDNLDITFSQSLPNATPPHHDLAWSRGLASDPNNYANFANIPSSSSTQSLHNVQTLPPHHQSIELNAPAKASASQSDRPNTVKNPKKRTRASRRAPTTVLTTDTTNFRQMVQEFTGIPTAPFSASGSPYSRRLDLFSTGTSNLRSAAHLDSLGGGPLYHLRLSAQKVHQLSSPSPLLNSSNLIDSLVSGAANPGNNSNLIPSMNILNMQNQMLSFQGDNNNNNSTSIPSFLQNPSSVKLPPSSSTIAAKSQGIHASMGSFDELGLGHHHHENVNMNVNAGLNSAGLFPGSERWRDGGGGGGEGAAAEALKDNFDGNKQHLISNYKFNCSASTSEFHHEKGLENVASGGEGTVGSWICPSD